MNHGSSYKKKGLSKSDAVLQSLFENGKSPLSGPFLRWKLWRKWADFVGPTIGNVSEPVSLRNGVLSIWVKNSTWLQQMLFLKQQICENLNQKLGQNQGENIIRDIHFTLDRKALPTDLKEKEKLQKMVQNLIKEGGS